MIVRLSGPSLLFLMSLDQLDLALREVGWVAVQAVYQDGEVDVPHRRLFYVQVEFMFDAETG